MSVETALSRSMGSPLPFWLASAVIVSPALVLRAISSWAFAGGGRGMVGWSSPWRLRKRGLADGATPTGVGSERLCGDGHAQPRRRGLARVLGLGERPLGQLAHGLPRA